MLKKYKIVTNNYEDIIGIESGWVTHPGQNTRFFFGFTMEQLKEWCHENKALLLKVK